MSASRSAAGDHAEVVAAVAGVDHDALAAQPRTGLAHLLLLAQEHGAPATGPRRGQVVQLADGRGAAHAVRRSGRSRAGTS